MKGRKYGWGIGLAALWAACFCAITPQAAYAQGAMSEIQNITRGKLWESFEADGHQGFRDEAVTFLNPSLAYPGQHTSDNGDWPWGGSIYNTIVNFQQVRNNCTAGEGYWILVKEGEGDADHTVSMVNFRQETPDIVKMIYKPWEGPEKDLGIQDTSPAGAPKSNYWPGVTEIPEGPVEIHNYAYGRYVMDDTFPEEIIIQQVATKRGITLTKKAYAWSYPDYDDLFIVEVTLTNTGDTDGDGAPDAGLPVTLPEVYYVAQTPFAISEGGALAHHGYTGNARAPWYGTLTRDDWYA